MPSENIAREPAEVLKQATPIGWGMVCYICSLVQQLISHNLLQEMQIVLPAMCGILLLPKCRIVNLLVR